LYQSKECDRVGGHMRPYGQIPEQLLAALACSSSVGQCLTDELVSHEGCCLTVDVMCVAGPDSTAVVNPRIAPRLALAVERSVAVVAAFTNFDVYASPSSTAGAHGSNTTGSSSHPSGQSSSQQGGPSLGHGAAQSQTHSLRNAPGTDPQPSPLQLSSSLSPPAAPWQPWSRPRTAAKRSLVGFARAAGDGALVSEYCSSK
jgi:hypothetical protein